MFTFQSQVFPGFFSRIDQFARDEFSTAQARVRRLSPAAARVEECMGIVQRCFSERTRTHHAEAVDFFLHKARSFLVLSSNYVTVEQEVVEEECSAEARADVAGPPADSKGEDEDLQPSPRGTKRVSETNVSDPSPKRLRISNPSLITAVKIFLSFDPRRFFTLDQIGSYWENRRQALLAWTEKFKQKELLAGRPEQEVALETQQFEEEAVAMIAQREKYERIVAEFDQTLPLFDEHKRPPVGSNLPKSNAKSASCPTSIRKGAVQPSLLDVQERILHEIQQNDSDDHNPHSSTPPPKPYLP